MKKTLSILITFLCLLMLCSCEEDHSINTTNLEGYWFVKRIELTDARHIDNEIYKVSNAIDYDFNNLRNGCLMVKITPLSDLNHYLVVLNKFDGSNWINIHHENVSINGNNKFNFYNYLCKFRKLEKNSNYMEIKVDDAENIYRYYFRKVFINL